MLCIGPFPCQKQQCPPQSYGSPNLRLFLALIWRVGGILICKNSCRVRPEQGELQRGTKRCLDLSS